LSNDTLLNVFFAVAGVLGCIGGLSGAYQAFASLDRRHPDEAGRRPDLERRCSAIIDYGIAAGSFCRFAVYDDFFLIESGVVEERYSFSELKSVTAARWCGRQSVLLLLHPHATLQDVRLFLGAESGEVARMLQARMTAARMKASAT
jgi:hypothetical protein